MFFAILDEIYYSKESSLLLANTALTIPVPVNNLLMGESESHTQHNKIRSNNVT